jgi:hypothetical protein
MSNLVVIEFDGKQPVNASVQGFYNIAKPDNIGPEWSIRFTFQFLFPR